VIIRIMGEGQLRVDDTAVAELNHFDSDLEKAVERQDEAAFDAALHALLGRARELGTALPPDAIEPSDLILPREGATMAEVHELLADGGLIPG
jgi:PspA-Associated protein